MTCAEFERDLAELMGGETPEAERPSVVERLYDHAAGCEACAGSLPLIALMARPAGQRDLVESPDESYWQDFDRRLDARLATEPASAEARSLLPRATRGRPAWLAAAAVVVVLLLGGLWLVNRTPGERPPTDGSWVAAVEPSPLPELELSGELADLLDPTTPGVTDALETLAGVDGTWVDPESDEPEAGYERILGEVAPQLELLTLEGLAWAEGASGGGSRLDDALFPDTADLEPDARRALLEWLRQQTPAAPASRGVS